MRKVPAIILVVLGLFAKVCNGQSTSAETADRAHLRSLTKTDCPWIPESAHNSTQKFSLHTETVGPSARYDLNRNRWLEIWRDGAHPHFCFLQNDRVIYSQPLSPGKEISVERPEVSQDLDYKPWLNSPPKIDPNAPSSDGLILVKLSSKSSFDVVICEHSSTEFDYSIFNISKGFPKVATLKTKLPGSIERIGNEPQCKMKFRELLPDFGIEACTANIVYGFKHGKFQMDAKSMTTELLNPSSGLAAKAAVRARFKEVDYAPVELSDYVFQYYFCGKIKEARAFVDSVWPHNRPGKRDYWRFVKSEVRKSSFYPNIKVAIREQQRAHQ